MNIILIALSIVLVVPALYLLFSRRSTGGSGGDRHDSVERPELTGPEQYKKREPK